MSWRKTDLSLSWQEWALPALLQVWQLFRSAPREQVVEVAKRVPGAPRRRKPVKVVEAEKAAP